MFPATYVQNFYDNPDEVRKFALEQTYHPNDGRWPGTRSKELCDINRPLFDEFSNKLFSMFYDFNRSNVRWKISTSFQVIPRFSDNKDSPKNRGWIHIDNEVIFAGIIYLTPGIDRETGTSLYKLVDPRNLSKENDDVKHLFLRDGIDNGNYDETIFKHNSCFQETVRFYNEYNSMVLIPPETWHGVNSYYSDGEPRLTQVFFVQELQTDSGFPLKR